MANARVEPVRPFWEHRLDMARAINIDDDDSEDDMPPLGDPRVHEIVDDADDVEMLPRLLRRPIRFHKPVRMAHWQHARRI